MICNIWPGTTDRSWPFFMQFPVDQSALSLSNTLEKKKKTKGNISWKANVGCGVMSEALFELCHRICIEKRHCHDTYKVLLCGDGFDLES